MLGDRNAMFATVYPEVRQTLIAQALAGQQQPGQTSEPAPTGGGGSGQIVNLSAGDILSSYAKGAANSVAQSAVNLLYGIGQVVSMGDLGKMAGGPPQVQPFTPTSNYFAAQGGATAQGVTAVAGGVGLGRTLAGRTAVRTTQSNFGDLTNGDDSGPQYHDRVRQRALEDPVGHNFPPSYDSEILATDPIPRPNNYTIFRKPGSLNGNDGVFEIGVNKDGVINHRVFRSNK